MIYLDHNAGSPLRPEARAAMLHALGVGGNASSVHSAGRRARRIVEDARETVAAALNVRSAQVVFTSGGTEANALGLSGRQRVLASAVEHPAVLDQSSVVKRRIAVLADGTLNLDDLVAALAETGAATVAVMAANNETGVIQPLALVAELAQAVGARLHVDAVQGPGRLDLMDLMRCADSLALSGHKFGAPAGVGALIVADADDVQPMLRGGGQERSRRPGTENVAGIAGFAAALQATLDPTVAAKENRRLQSLRDRLEQGLPPRIRVAGETAPRVASTSCLLVPERRGETLVIALDLHGIAVSSGAACSSGKVKRSHVLAAMGVDDDIVANGLRVSLGWSTQATDIDALLRVLPKVTAPIAETAVGGC